MISDAHKGLKQAISEVMQGASWQRCRMHFMRNILSHVPRAMQAMVVALVRTIFVQPDMMAAKAQLARVAESLEKRFPRAAELLRDAEDDTLAYMAFPCEHWRQIYSTNTLERLNREIGRRTDVVGIFPNCPSLIRLADAILQEQSDEWAAAPRRYFSKESMAKLRSMRVGQNQREEPLLLDAYTP